MGKRIKVTVKIAKVYPQAAYFAFTSGFRQNFICIISPLSNVSHLLQPIENFIWQEFMTFLLEGRTCNDEERQLLSVHVKTGGMGITNISSISDMEYKTSKKTIKT